MGRKKPPEAAAGHDTLVLRTKTLLAGMAHGRADRTSRRAEIPPPEEAALRAASTKGGGRLRRPPPFVDSSGGGISALRLVRSVHSCAMLAKSVFVLKTKVSCPAAASGGFVRPKNWSRSEVGQKSQNLESSQNGLAYSGKS